MILTAVSQHKMAGDDAEYGRGEPWLQAPDPKQDELYDDAAPFRAGELAQEGDILVTTAWRKTKPRESR